MEDMEPFSSRTLRVQAKEVAGKLLTSQPTRTNDKVFLPNTLVRGPFSAI